MRLVSIVAASVAFASALSSPSVAQEPTGADYIKFFKPLVGTWVGKAVGGGETHDRKWTLELSPTGTCFVTYETEDGKPFYQSIDGYDPVTKKYTVVGFYSDGLREEFSYQIDKNTLQGSIEGFTYAGRADGQNAEGEAISCDYTSTIVNRNKWVITVTNNMKAGKNQPNLTITYERQQ